MTRWMNLMVLLAVGPALLAQEPKKDEPKPQEAQPEMTKPAEPQPAAGLAYAKLETTLGDIVLELNAEKAPISTKNFLDYADAGFYNGTIFHRVMSTFMIQGGGYTPDMEKKKDAARPAIKNEWQNGLKNTRGTIAMARMGGQADSATNEFFINVVDNPSLDKPNDGSGYAVFGRVVAGLDVVDKIKSVPVVESPKLPMGRVVPKEPVVIKSVKKLDADAAKAAMAEAEKAVAKAAEEAKAAADKVVQDALAKIEAETGKKAEKTASGLMFVILKEGDGAQPAKTDRVSVHYTGWLLNGDKFDSSVDRGQPFEFSLTGGVIPGWLEGVALMKVGEKRKLIIPAELGYGARGSPPKIPGNSMLVFDVELLAIK